MENTTVWITIAVYVAVMIIIGIVSGRKSNSIADLDGRRTKRRSVAFGAFLRYGIFFGSYVCRLRRRHGTQPWSLGYRPQGIGNAVFGSWLAWRVLARRTRDVSDRLKIKNYASVL